MMEQAESVKKLLYTFSPKNKDIVLLLDYSQSMSDGFRIDYAVKNLLKAS